MMHWTSSTMDCTTYSCRSRQNIIVQSFVATGILPNSCTQPPGASSGSCQPFVEYEALVVSVESLFQLYFGRSPWLKFQFLLWVLLLVRGVQAYARCLFCRGGVFRLSMLVRNWTVASVRKFLTSMNCLERRFLAKAEVRGLLHLVLRERRSRALVRMHAWRGSE